MRSGARALALAVLVTASLLRCATTGAPASSSRPPCEGFTPPVRAVVGRASVPDSFLIARLGGEVVQEVVIARNGTSGPARLVRARTPELAPFAELALQRSRFTPASFEGNPVAARVLVSTTVGIVRKARKEPVFDTLWVHVPGGESREARWQLAGSVRALALVAHVGSALPKGGEIIARAPGGAERVLLGLSAAAAAPGEIRQIVKTGNFFADAGDYQIALRAGTTTLAATTLTIAPDYSSAIINACAPL